MKIKVLLVDDHAVVRKGLSMLLEDDENIEIVGEAGTASKAIESVNTLIPDVIIMDIGLPDMSGIEATKYIKELWPEVNIVALTIHEDEEYFFKMLEAGASGYVPKRAAPDELVKAILVAAKGDVYLYPSLAKVLVQDIMNQKGEKDKKDTSILTPREHEILSLLADGDTNIQIADNLHISPNTVARHRENIMQKLDLHSRTELVRYAIRKGIIHP